MKIALTGAGGTGKGTLARAITDKYSGIIYIPSSVEFVGKTMFPNLKSYVDIKALDNSVRWQYQYAAVMAQMQSEHLFDGQYLSFLAERSVFDFLAYVQDMPTEEKVPYADMILNYYDKNPYDVIFYLPADDFEPKDNSPWKEREESSRQKTDEFLRNLIFESTCCVKSQVFELRGSVKERAENAMEIVRDVVKHKIYH